MSVQQPIAILDSGVGGLTVVKEIMKQLPNERIVYFGDTARAPYGPRNNQEVLEFTGEIIQYLMQYEPKMIIIACNTATAVALSAIRAKVAIPVIGVIEPGARAAVRESKSKCIGVIGTEGTINSKVYEQVLYELCQDVKIISGACPAFVPLVEAGHYGSEEAEEIVRLAIGDMKNYPIDCLILGCTHYPFLTREIAKVMGSEVSLIHSGEETAIEAKCILKNRFQLQHEAVLCTHHFISSSNTHIFQAIAKQWLEVELRLQAVLWRVVTLHKGEL